MIRRNLVEILLLFLFLVCRKEDFFSLSFTFLYVLVFVGVCSRIVNVRKQRKQNPRRIRSGKFLLTAKLFCELMENKKEFLMGEKKECSLFFCLCNQKKVLILKSPK